MPKAPKDCYQRLRPFLPIFRKYFAPKFTLLLKKTELKMLDKALHEHCKALSKAFFWGKPDCYSDTFFVSMNYLASHVSSLLSKSNYKPYRWEKIPLLSLASSSCFPPDGDFPSLEKQHAWPDHEPSILELHFQFHVSPTESNASAAPSSFKRFHELVSSSFTPNGTRRSAHIANPHAAVYEAQINDDKPALSTERYGSKCFNKPTAFDSALADEFGEGEQAPPDAKTKVTRCNIYVACVLAQVSKPIAGIIEEKDLPGALPFYERPVYSCLRCFLSPNSSCKFVKWGQKCLKCALAVLHSIVTRYHCAVHRLLLLRQIAQDEDRDAACKAMDLHRLTVALCLHLPPGHLIGRRYSSEVVIQKIAELDVNTLAAFDKEDNLFPSLNDLFSTVGTITLPFNDLLTFQAALHFRTMLSSATECTISPDGLPVPSAQEYMDQGDDSPPRSVSMDAEPSLIAPSPPAVVLRALSVVAPSLPPSVFGAPELLMTFLPPNTPEGPKQGLFLPATQSHSPSPALMELPPPRQSSLACLPPYKPENPGFESSPSSEYHPASPVAPSIEVVWSSWSPSELMYSAPEAAQSDGHDSSEEIWDQLMESSPPVQVLHSHLKRHHKDSE